MRTTLVTGASGFIGSHLINEMRLRNLPVRGLSQRHQEGLITIPSYGPEMDWSDWLVGVNCIVHLAARVHIMRETSADPLSAFRVANVDATLNLARQAAKIGVKRFIFVSTIKVNGESTKPGKPFTSDDLPDPQDPYSVSKAEAEAKLIALGHETCMEIVIIRPPLVYGPGVGGNFRRLLQWAKRGIPSVFLAVHNVRSLIYVGNLCDLLITVLDAPAAANQILLVADGKALSTNELLATLAGAFGRDRREISIPPNILWAIAILSGRRLVAQRLLCSLEVNTDATRRILSWVPPYSTVEGLNLLAQEKNLSRFNR